MPEFLRKPKYGEVKEGETFTDVVKGEVIAQVCHKGECVEVRKSLKNKAGKLLPSSERAGLIDEAKKEVLDKCKTKEEKKATKKAKKASSKK